MDSISVPTLSGHNKNALRKLDLLLSNMTIANYTQDMDGNTPSIAYLYQKYTDVSELAINLTSETQKYLEDNFNGGATVTHDIKDNGITLDISVVSDGVSHNAGYLLSLEKSTLGTISNITKGLI